MIARDVQDYELVMLLLADLGSLLVIEGDYALAEEYLQESNKNARQLKDKRLIGNSLLSTSELHLNSARLDEALVIANEALVIARELNAPYFIATALHTLDKIAQARNDLSTAHHLGEESIAMLETVDPESKQLFVASVAKTNDWVASLP